MRPDPGAKPGLAALWERLWGRQAARYRGFDHLVPRPETTTVAKKTPALGIDPLWSCGYSLDSTGDPFISLFITGTVPDLQFVLNPWGPWDNFHTFVGLGFLDVYVEMTVDSGQNVTSWLWAQAVGNINLPVRPGDVMSASLCLENGTAYYFLANETTSKTMNFVVDTGWPPAMNINAGVTRDAYTPRSNHWPTSGSSISTISAPPQLAATRFLHRAPLSRWLTKTAPLLLAQSSSTTTPSRRCVRPDCPDGMARYRSAQGGPGPGHITQG